jgi:hypothetical protein
MTFAPARRVCLVLLLGLLTLAPAAAARGETWAEKLG